MGRRRRINQKKEDEKKEDEKEKLGEEEEEIIWKGYYTPVGWLASRLLDDLLRHLNVELGVPVVVEADDLDNAPQVGHPAHGYFPQRAVLARASLKPAAYPHARVPRSYMIQTHCLRLNFQLHGLSSLAG